MISKANNLVRRPFFYSLIFFCSVALAAGQIAGGMTETTNVRHGGNNYIVGTVFWPSGEPINIRMRIRLSSPTSGDVLAMTDDSGKFVFSGVGSGVYTILIDGEKEFEPVMQEVDITRLRSPVPETYSVTIRLRNAASVRTKADKPSVINTADAGVPKRAMNHYKKAQELAIAKDNKGAIEQLKLAVAEYPGFMNAFNEMGVLYMRLNELDKADEALQAALKIKPDAYEPLINRGILLCRSARFKDAEPILRGALKAKADSAVARYYLGRALHKMGRNDEAEAEFLALIKISPGEFREAHRLLAVIYLDRGDGQRVIEQLETYLRLVPAAPDAEQLRKVIEQIKGASKTPQTDRKPGN